VPPAHSRYTLARLCAGEVALRTTQAGHQRQGFGVGQAATAAGVGSSREPAGQPPSAQPLLEKGDADAELAGELTPRGRPFVAGSGDLGTSSSGVGFHTTILLGRCSTANCKPL
jgi:hypothetical protein